MKKDHTKRTLLYHFDILSQALSSRLRLDKDSSIKIHMSVLSVKSQLAHVLDMCMQPEI